MLRLDGVNRRFGRFVAVQDLSFEIAEPGVVGLLGPNGAGKTTTMRLIAGALMPSSGEIYVAGRRMRSEAACARGVIGFLPETPPLYAEMTVRAYLGFAGRLRGLTRRDAGNRALAVAQSCAIQPQLDATIGTLSRGQRQRVGIAQAIVHDPALLILDEPTEGLDPLQLVEARRLIRDLARERVVLLSTHDLHAAETLCDRILFIRSGRLEAERTRGDAPRTGPSTISLFLRDPAADVAPRLAALDGVRGVRVEDGRFLLDVAAGAEPNRAVTALVHEAGWTLLGFDTSRAGLETLFLPADGGERA